ncbi:MAG: zinc-ribbon domain-containing protein, partial [Myxococcaceae bacterium]
MKVSCPSCQTNYKIDDKRIPPGGAKLKCAKCETTFPIKPDAPPAPSAGAIPLPGMAAPRSGAIPLPGITAAVAAPATNLDSPRWDEESTRVVSIPLPSAAYSPGKENATRIEQFPSEPPAESTQVAVPLPGRGMSSPAPFAIPLPGAGEAPMSADPFAIPLPGAPPAAIPLPGITPAFAEPASNLPPGEGARWDEESTRVQSIPLPGAAFGAPAGEAPSFDYEQPSGAQGFEGGAVPLPGAGGWDQAPADEAPQESAGIDFADADLVDPPPSAAPTQTGRAIPLPGGAAPGAIPLPGSSRAGASANTITSIPLPGAGSGAPHAIPLPGSARRPDPPTSISASPFEFEAPPPPEPQAAGLDFSDLPSPAGSPPQEAPGSFDFADLPSPAGSPPPATGGFELVDPPPPAAEPPPNSFDFADLPPPPGQNAQAAAPSFELDFANLPSPSSAPEPSFPSSDQTDLPSPGAAPPLDDFAVDFGSPPKPGAPPAPASSPAPMEFGDVDIGGGSQGAADALEFDPTAKAAAEPDELEADLSAPIPAPSSAASTDGLEMLDFIDHAAKDAKASPKVKAKRFHIRRRSGKVFGPFDEGVVVKMLEDGQLLGNEDASTDGDTWAAIGTVPSFGQVIQRLMESPSKAMTTAMPVSEARRSADESAKTMDRLKDLYEGRMAAVAVVDSSAASAALRRRIPFFIAGGVLLVILGTGGFLATTRYGFFGIKALLPAKISAGTKEFADLQQAQKGLLGDTFKSYQEARDAAAAALKVKEYPEARAVWCQAIFYLHRRYAAAKPAELATAKAALEDIQLLGKKHPEVVKAMAGSALAGGSADAALALLEDAFARAGNGADVELAFLRAEGYGQKGQGKLALEGLKKVLEKHKDSAKALHAVGNLHQASKEADEAAKAYEEALKADPNHVV